MTAQVKVEITVRSYDEGQDAFKVEIFDTAINTAMPITLEAGLLAMLVGEYDEPHEFVGKTFTLFRNAA